MTHAEVIRDANDSGYGEESYIITLMEGSKIKRWLCITDVEHEFERSLKHHLRTRYKIEELCVWRIKEGRLVPHKCAVPV